MNTIEIILTVVFVALFAVSVGMFIYYRNTKKKAAAQNIELAKTAQSVSMLVIDKKRMRMKEANLPKVILDQTPKYLQTAKIPFVKAKVGPKIQEFVCDESIFDLIPVKKEIKASISGIYIVSVKGLRAPIQPKKKMFSKKKKKETVV